MLTIREKPARNSRIEGDTNMTTVASAAIFTVAKNGYGTEPSLRFSTYEEAEKKFIEYGRAGYKNAVIIERRPDGFFGN